MEPVRRKGMFNMIKHPGMRLDCCGGVRCCAGLKCRAGVLALFVALVSCLIAVGPGCAEELAADQIIAKVKDARTTAGFRIRAKLVHTQLPSEKRDARQLLIKGRRDGESITVLYQLIWPSAFAGHSLVVEKSADHKLGGFLFEQPDKVTSLTPSLVTQRFFESDFTIEDVIEGYWDWPLQKIVGEESVKGRLCKILESRPSTDTSTAYSLVKTWVATDIAMALRVETFGKDGELVKRIRVDKFVKQADNHWAAAIVTVEPADGKSRTTLEGTKSERDLDIPAEEFTLEKIKSAHKPAP